jgi:hypothetical protein
MLTSWTLLRGGIALAGGGLLAAAESQINQIMR